MEVSATWAELGERVGTLDQVASATPVTLAEGPGAGVRALEVRVLDGIDATVLLDRGMDVGQARHRGTPLAWISPTGPVHPAFAAGGDWFGSFHGGLLVTAGTQNVGEACELDGVRHPLHGRLSHIPARDVRWTRTDDPPELVVEGVVREVSVLGVDVELRRRLRFAVGVAQLTVEDAIENRGETPVPLMLLYHVNVGWPVVDAGARLFGFPATVRPRAGDAAAAAAIAEHARFGPPTAGWPSQVFEHVEDDEPPVRRVAGIHNPRWGPTDGIAVAVAYAPRELPRLWRWRMLGRGAYLVAIEPANCSLAGRASAMRAGEPLVELAPGATHRYTITLSAGVGQAARALAGVGAEPPET